VHLDDTDHDMLARYAGQDVLAELMPVLRAGSPRLRCDFLRHLGRVDVMTPPTRAVAIALACAAHDARERTR
jgi:hypothetical protein